MESPLRRLVSDEIAVSSVVGTVLVLGITVTVFGGLSVGVLAYFQAHPDPPRTDIGVLKQGSSYLLVNQGGDQLGLGTQIVWDNNGVLESFTLAQLRDSSGAMFTQPWKPGTSICIAGPDLARCAADSATANIRGSFVVAGGAVIATEGVVSGVSATSTTGAATADLTVTAITLSPTGAAVGQNQSFVATLTNSGGTATGAVSLTVQFRLNGTTTLGYRSVAGPLAAGASVNLTFSSWVPTGTGTHSIQAIADPNGTVVEASEANNQLSQSFSVAAGVSDPGEAFEDLNGDGVYTPGTDSLLGTALSDCAHTASNGLVIPASVGTINATSCNFEAGGDIVIAAGVVLNSTGSLNLIPGNGDDLNASGATLISGSAIQVGSTANGQLPFDINLVGTIIDNTGGSSGISIDNEGGTINAANATILSKGAIDIGGEGGSHVSLRVILTGATISNNYTGTTSQLHIEDVSGAIEANGSRIMSRGAIVVTAGTWVGLDNATVDNSQGGANVAVTATAGDLYANTTTIRNGGSQISLTVSSTTWAYVQGAVFLDNNNLADVSPNGRSLGTASAGVE